MKTLSQLIQNKKKSSYSTSIDEKTIFFLFDRYITDEYGRKGSLYIQPKVYTKKKLVITCQSSLWANELWLNKALVIRKLNHEIGSEEIQDIIIGS